MKYDHNSHDVAESMIKHFDRMLSGAREVLNKVNQGEKHGRKKKYQTACIDIGRSYVYGHGYVGVRPSTRYKTFGRMGS